MRCHYAVDLGNQRVETDEGQERIKGIRNNFIHRSVLLYWRRRRLAKRASTFTLTAARSFNGICLRIQSISNNVRGGSIASKVGDSSTHCKQVPEPTDDESVQKSGFWDASSILPGIKNEPAVGKCDLIPFWHIEADKYKIERIIPFYPFSRDRSKLSSLLRTLAIYRLTFGQPAKRNLSEHLLTNIPDERISEIRSRLMIDLSPVSYRRGNGLGTTH